MSLDRRVCSPQLLESFKQAEKNLQRELAQKKRAAVPKSRVAPPKRRRKSKAHDLSKPLHDGRKQQQPMPYTAYLRTQHWSIVRTKMVKWARHRCNLCGTKVHINVHHLSYAHLWYEYAADLQVLCRTCHAKAHGKE